MKRERRAGAAKAAALVLFVLLALGLESCDGGEAGGKTGSGTPAGAVIRVAVIADPPRGVGRGGGGRDRLLARELAEELGAGLEIVEAGGYREVERLLVEGRADVAARPFMVTEAREERIDFSTPLAHVDELIVTRKEAAGGIDSPEALRGREACLAGSSPHAATLAAVEGLKVRVVYGGNTEETLLDMVSTGECFSTVVRSDLWDELAPLYGELAAALRLAASRPLSLALRPGDEELRQSINRFIIARALTDDRKKTYTDDLPGLKRRRLLRMLTRNNALSYYIYRGEEFGFDYELVRKFAEENSMHLEVVVAPARDELLRWLNEGRGDIVAAALTITDERRERAAFTIPYNRTEEVLVVREDYELHSPAELAGKTVHVRRSSAYYSTLKELSRTVGLHIETVPEEMETEDILAAVEDGTFDITVCDSDILGIERTYGRRLRAALSLRPVEHGWAVRRDNPKLLAALNRFIKKNHRGLFYNMTRRRYMEDSKQIAEARGGMRTDKQGVISPYDDLFRKHAARLDLDWRLLAALAYQESKFNPRARSWAGAVGIMQLQPRTARELGVRDMRDPEQNIKAGAEYLRGLIDRFDPSLELQERIRFALASYNVGINHVRDARRLARRLGLSPDKWFDNVERAMRLLSRRKYYRTVRYGYCRGFETVKYVREIQKRYNTYTELVKG
ncbi:MAG TPA: membrane-bound lytic murein transglycosylase MltF [Deltaproteobacteria bacterium]|nr:membrane-bound lytic murein transglycosylase MltF [Deltaproteobacteria bacterium]